MNKTYDTIVIGGGSSGMFASISASQNGKKILVIEKNPDMGAKLKISGGGRCNILNNEEDTRVLLSHYGEAEKYLYTAFSKFGVKETRDFFKKIGIEIKIEDRKRAFPVSEKAIDVFDALKREMEKNKIEIMCDTKVEEIVFEAAGDVKKVIGVKVKVGKNKSEIFTARKYILATGGYSHPETGSTGDGFKFLEKAAGVKINPPNPSLVPVKVRESWVKKLRGKSVENVKLSFFVDGEKKKVLKITDKKSIETKNRILFTHFGLSGPTILNMSKDIYDWLSEGDVFLFVDLFPQMDEKQLDTFILQILNQNLNKNFKNILNEIYAGNILENILEEIEIENFSGVNILNKKVNDIRVTERKALINILKNLKINITGLMGFDKAIIASGGVDVSEVDFSNMRLKKVENLYVTGDMLDIERPSGGYSLQLCWTTGYVAGSVEK